jgi:hypothetical protein
VTKPEEYLDLMRRARMAEDEAYYLRRQAHEVRRAMGDPDVAQIERAAEMGREIRRGCADDP